MNYELFEQQGLSESRIEAEERQEVLELSLDDLSYVGGGYRKTDFHA